MNQVSITVNGKQHKGEVSPRTLLVHFIRDVLQLTGTHIGCDTSSCGACTVLIDGKAIKSCTVLAVQVNGQEVITVEGLSGGNGALHPLQEAFNEYHGLQCGFCTPGMIMMASDLLSRNASPSENDIRHALEGNYCRCTGYHNIVRSVQHAADKIQSNT